MWRPIERLFRYVEAAYIDLRVALAGKAADVEERRLRVKRCQLEDQFRQLVADGLEVPISRSHRWCRPRTY